VFRLGPRPLEDSDCSVDRPGRSSPFPDPKLIIIRQESPYLQVVRQSCCQDLVVHLADGGQQAHRFANPRDRRLLPYSRKPSLLEAAIENLKHISPESLEQVFQSRRGKAIDGCRLPFLRCPEWSSTASLLLSSCWQSTCKQTPKDPAGFPETGSSAETGSSPP
jgi:hypothetical protein